jgi:hypothetical protein
MMALIKHVNGVDVEMTPEEEAEFLASLPQEEFTPPGNLVTEMTKEQLLMEIQKLTALVNGLP